MVQKARISGMRPGDAMKTKKGNRERFALVNPLVKPLTKRLAGLPRYTSSRPHNNMARWMHDHSDLAEARRGRYI